MKNKRFLLALSSMALIISACSDNSENKPKKDDPIVDPEPAKVADNISIDSVRGCALDSDCQTGAFCFQGQCVAQCIPGKVECDDGYKCYANRGRCVTDAFLTEAANVAKQIQEAGDAVTPEQRANYDFELDLKAAKSSNVSNSVIGQTDLFEGNTIDSFKIISKLPKAISNYNEEGNNVAVLQTSASAGDVYYAVVEDDAELPILKKALYVKNDENTYSYLFEINSKAILDNKNALLRDIGKPEIDEEVVTLHTSLGSSELTVYGSVPASAIYKGYVTPMTTLSGTPLPIRMAIETTPANPQSFDDITAIKLYLPTSEQDLFSPENVTVLNDKNTETWSYIEITTKDTAANCSRQTPCFAADFSTNDYAPVNSRLFDKNQRVNRSMRFEIYDYDASTLSFNGVLKDKFSGLYRTRDITNKEVQISYNDDELVANFEVHAAGMFDKDSLATQAHQYQTKEIRDIALAPKFICSNAEISELMHSIQSAGECSSIENESEKADCEKIVSCQKGDFENLDDNLRFFCSNKLAQNVLDDDARLSVILEKVLTKSLEHETSSEPVAVACGKDIHNFKDFVDVCNTEGCDLCKERPELMCIADLMANTYLTTTADEDTKGSLMKNWLSVMRESYLAQEYLAWSQDTTIRREWLEGGNAYNGTFASNIMDNFNAGLLKKFREQVLDVHHDIMKKQFNQTTLEMLAESIVDNGNVDGSALSSARNSILSEMSQTWESLAQSLGLSARRNDVLTQQDDQRLAAADELRPVLFDLYFAALFESALNKRADQGSLNASYGSNLGAVISKLDSLDQPFESLVFMRDGEILVDNRVITDVTETEIGRLQKTAEDSVSTATAKRKEIFKTIDDREMTQANIKESYESDLEKLRAEIVNLCGYPADCSTQEERDSCKIMTDPYFCGFSLSSHDKSTLSLKTTDKDIDISQMICYAGCYALTDEQKSDPNVLANLGCTGVSNLDSLGCGGNLASESNSVNYAEGTNYSKAALAILDYRQAEQEYRTAVSNYDVMRLKVRNTFETLDAYAQNIEKWHNDRQTVLKNIAKNIDNMNTYAQGIVDYQYAIEAAKVTEAAAETVAETTAYAKWYALTSAKQAEDAMFVSADVYQIEKVLTLQAKVDKTEARIYNNSLSNIADSARNIDAYLNPTAAASQQTISNFKNYKSTNEEFEKCLKDYNASLNNPSIDNAGRQALKTKCSKMQNELSKMMGNKYISNYKSSVTELTNLNISMEKSKLQEEFRQSKFEYQLEVNDRTKAEAIKTLQSSLAAATLAYKETIEINGEKISGRKADFEKAIAELERDNELLLQSIKSEETYARDIQDLAFRRTEYKNTVLDLIELAEQVKVKEIAKQRAYIEYMNIVQQAQLVSSQYNNKFRRYQEISDITFSAAKFFQVASDLESAESFIEFARNDLNDYLTGIEYMTVRPYVDLRRSIYTARGTNELELIKAQIDDLTNKCGTGKESTNTVNISLKSRLGIIDKPMKWMSAATRFHNIMRTATLPISAQTIYSADGKLGDVLKKGEFYSGSFDLTSTFANLATTCNAKIKSMRVRFVSVPGKKIRESGDAVASVSIFYGGQSQLLSCHSNIEAITSSIGSRTSFGKYSTFMCKPFGGGANVGLYDVGADEDYALSDTTEFSDVSVFNGFKGYPLMATYTIIFDPNAGENKGINWNNVADVELQIEYTTGTVKQNDQCKYDIQ